MGLIRFSKRKAMRLTSSPSISLRARSLFFHADHHQWCWRGRPCGLRLSCRFPGYFSGSSQPEHQFRQTH